MKKSPITATTAMTATTEQRRAQPDVSRILVFLQDRLRHVGGNARLREGL